MKSYKLIIGEILTSPFVCAIISPFFPKDILNFKRYKVDLSASQNFIKASVFWGLYERSELKMISSRIYTKLPVIELGASLGLTSLAVQSKVKNEKVISVEANTKLIRNLENTKQLNNLVNWTILNYAIDYSGKDYINFEVDAGNLGSKKSFEASINTIEIKSASLMDIYKKNLSEENFVLIADIEGGEIEIILEDNVLLREKCKQMILELHDTAYKGIDYSKENIANLIIERTNMKTIYTDGKTWVFQ